MTDRDAAAGVVPSTPDADRADIPHLGDAARRSSLPSDSSGVTPLDTGTSGRRHSRDDEQGQVGVDVVTPPRRADDVRTTGTGSAFWAPALLLTLAHVLLTAWRLRSTWWYQDDLVILARASRTSLGELLLTQYNGHLMPGTWAFARFVNEVDPLGWRWPAAAVCALVLLADTGMALLLARLVGARRAAVVPLAMYVSAGSLLTPTLWWAAAMQWLPATASLLWALYFHVGYWRLRRTRDAVGAVLAVLAGLAFFEKSALVVVVLLGFTVLYSTSGTAVERVRDAVRQAPGYWRAHVLAVGAFAAYYLSAAEGVSNGSWAPSDLLGLVRAVVLDVVVPSIFGGPLQWFGPYSGLPASPRWFQVTAWTLFGAAVAGSLWLRRGAWRAWTLLLGFAAATLGLVAATRLGFFGATIGLDGRYSADLVAFTVVCVALAWLPTVERPTTHRVERPAGVGDEPDDPPDEDQQSEQPAEGDAAPRRPVVGGAALRAAGTVFVAAVLLAGAVSGDRYMTAWTPPPAKGYVLTLVSELRTRPDVVLFDQKAPERVLQGTFGDESRLSTLLEPSGLRPTLRSWQTDLHIVDESGRIRSATLPGAPASSTASPLCAAPGQPLRVRLDGAPLPLGTWTLQFNYLVNEPSTLGLAFGLGSTDVDVEQGIHRVFVQVDGNGDSVVLTPPPEAQGLCVTNLVIGRPVAA